MQTPQQWADQTFRLKWDRKQWKCPISNRTSGQLTQQSTPLCRPQGQDLKQPYFFFNQCSLCREVSPLGVQSTFPSRSVSLQPAFFEARRLKSLHCGHACPKRISLWKLPPSNPGLTPRGQSCLTSKASYILYYSRFIQLHHQLIHSISTHLLTDDMSH